jgi:hypothetical protein
MLFQDNDMYMPLKNYLKEEYRQIIEIWSIRMRKNSTAAAALLTRHRVREA